jgi:hypothetical protein
MLALLPNRDDRRGGWSGLRSGHFTLKKRTPYAFYMTPIGPRSRTGRVRKLAPPSGFKRIRNDRAIDKREFHRKSKRLLFFLTGGGGTGKSTTFLQIFQSSGARHYDRTDNINVKKFLG